MMGRVIVTADDFGMCEAVNKAIEECMGRGIVRATCVMTNMPAYRAVLALREKFPHVSIGIHWNLTQGKPVLPPSEVPSLVGSGGLFHSLREFRRRWLLGKVDLAQLRAELYAQYKRFCDLAGQPDFWNTHENVHILPRLFASFVILGKELEIPAMRCHRRIRVSCQRLPSVKGFRLPLSWLKGYLVSRWSAWAEAKGMLMPDGRAPLLGIRSGEDVAKLLQRVPWNRVRKAVELVIHPAMRVEPGLFGQLTDVRVMEYEVFRDSRQTEPLARSGIEFVGFEVLSNGVFGKN